MDNDSTNVMLPKDVVVITPNSNGVGKILIREDTILANIQGCAGCGRAKLTCSGVKNSWSALCWGKQSEKRYYTSLILLSTAFVLSLIGTIFFTFTNTVNDVLLSSMVIRNNSLAYSMWRQPTVTPFMKVHIFNYTNWERVKHGLDPKLVVEDVGPYVYSQRVERVNINFDDDKLSFQERNMFTYLPEKSVGTDFDQIYVPNLPLLGVVSKAASMNEFARLTLNSLLRLANHPNAFLKLPVHRFLWGYEDSIISIAKPFLSLQGQLNFDNFGLLSSKNGTVSDILTINTGERDKERMNIIEKLNGEDHLKIWNSAECNSLEATDGSIFPPSLLDRKSALGVFYPNLCRKLPFLFEKDVEVDGIPLLRYRMPLDIFDDAEHNPGNQCYCEIDTGVCPPRGVINVTACAMGVPALASFPHFYLGDEKLREDIIGLNPDPLLHDSYVDVHPTLGLSLNGKSSMQINIEVKRFSAFEATSYLKQGMILPIAWIEMLQRVEELPDGIKSLVYHGTYSTAAVQLGLTVGFVISLIASGSCLFLLIVRRRQKPCATLKMTQAEMKSLNVTLS